MKPAIFTLSETRLTADIDDSEINMADYYIIRCDGETRNTGGVVFYVRQDVKCEIVLSNKIESNCWCIAIKIQEDLYKGTIMMVYHSPSASNGDFIRFLEDLVETLLVKGECMVVGDFNIDIVEDTFYAMKLKTTMQGLGMKQYVNSPTRTTKYSQTTIDLIFANSNVKVQVCNKPKITDHAWLKIDFNKKYSGVKYREITSRAFSKFNKDEFIRLLERNQYQCKN